ncbi:MAG: hypothetical protein CSA11_00550 [Chloroflexi bacterium]|nr:MAG: hypothetical protein CSA11_00550 [Chloroflexota bacterium]
MKLMRQRFIFGFWLPLFASWLLMTAEGPTISAAINRLPNEVTMMAAYGIVVSLSVLIESPIINLLATSTALVKDRASYLLVRRFTVHGMILLTVVTILVAFSPLFDVIVIDILETPLEVAQWVQPGMQIMTFWSAAIAWRRFLQGVMIHFGQTRKVAWGTGIRLVASAGTAVSLAYFLELPGVILGALALMAGVLTEAAYTTIAIRSILQHELAPENPPVDGDPLTYRELFWFHLPLALTSVLLLLVQPMVNASLARLPNPLVSLAAWPILFQITLMARAGALALPEVVIALSDRPNSFVPVRQFAFNLTIITTGLMLLFIVTPLAGFYIFVVQDMTSVVGDVVQASVVYFLLFPALVTIISWLRGLLINKRVTMAVNLGMVTNLVITAVVLLTGLYLQWSGIFAAALAFNLAAVGEILYLGWQTHSACFPV